MCLKSVIKADEKLKIHLNFILLSEEMIPLIVNLLGTFGTQNANVVWPLIDFLTLLFTKAQFTADNYGITQPIQSETMQKLLRLDNELVLGALCDMLRTVIASFPIYTPLT